MTNLSVNLNKIALLRNSRAANSPNLLHYARLALDAGAHGLTLHPRADERHARLDDVLAVAELAEIASGERELNVEGDLRPELVNLACAAAISQFTVVPVIPGELTSSRGWRAYDDHQLLSACVQRWRSQAPKMRISVFCDASAESVRLAHACGVDAVEFYTGYYANDKAKSQEHLQQLVAAAEYARSKQLRVHAGHDLDLDNLPELLRALRPDEVSIGHAISCDALEMGFSTAVSAYLRTMKV